MDIRIIIVFVLLTVLVSIQYSLNKIIVELKEIKKILLQNKIRN